MTSKDADSSGSAAQPAKADTTSLKELNVASAKSGGNWTVVVCHPFEDTYDYTWQGKQRTGSQLLITLVSPSNPEAYCLAQFRKSQSNTIQYKAAKAKFLEQTTFQMTKVAFSDTAKSQYVNTPVKLVVHLALTQMSAIVSLGQNASSVQPCPPYSLCDCSSLDDQQFLDVTALVNDNTPIRSVANNRQSFAVSIIDGSLDKATDKIKVLCLVVYDEKESEAFDVKKKLADNSVMSKHAVNFFCTKARKTKKGVTVSPQQKTFGGLAKRVEIKLPN